MSCLFIDICWNVVEAIEEKINIEHQIWSDGPFKMAVMVVVVWGGVMRTVFTFVGATHSHTARNSSA
jgi:hypothetical protein